MWMLASAFEYLGNIVRDDVLMLHRVQWKVDACHRTDFTRPKPACVDDMLGMHRAFVGHNIPCPIGPLGGLAHHAMRLDYSTTHTRRLGVGMRGARGVEMSV